MKKVFPIRYQCLLYVQVPQSTGMSVVHRPPVSGASVVGEVGDGAHRDKLITTVLLDFVFVELPVK